MESEINRIVGAHRRHLLEPRHMAVLLALVNAPDRTLTKAQLLDAVWPRSFVVDGVLKRAVWQLRRALGDDARAPRYIETVYKVGYRLLKTPRPWIEGIGRRLPATPYNMRQVCECVAREALCACQCRAPRRCGPHSSCDCRFAVVVSRPPRRMVVGEYK